MALNVSDSNFESILAEGKPVVLDFGLLGVALASKWLLISKSWRKNIKIVLTSENVM